MNFIRLNGIGKKIKYVFLFILCANFLYPQGAGHSVYYDRNDNFTVVPDADILDGMGELTVEAWVYYLGGDNTTWGIVVSKGLKYQLYRYENSNHIAVSLEGITSGDIDTGVDFDIDSWQHIAFTYDGSTLKIYKNGKLINTTTGLSGAVGFCDNDLVFGAWYGNDVVVSSPWYGYIDEVRIWRTARTESELKSYMNRKLTGGENQLIGYWRFDENSGNSANDLTSQNNDGAIFGTQGIAENGSYRYLIDNDKSWTTDEWTDETIEITSGAGAGQSRTIGSNTSVQININGSDFNPDAANGSVYRVSSDAEWNISHAAIGDYSNYGEGSSDLVKTADVPIDINWTNSPGTNAIFSAIQNNEYPESAAGLLTNYPEKYWEIWIRRDDGDFAANVDFHFDNIGGISNENNLKLYTRQQSGDVWSEAVNYTIYTEGDETDGIGYIRANGLTSFSQFIITSQTEPLPVELTSFTAGVFEDKVILNWTTAAEVNNYGFQVQRQKEKVRDVWENIGFVQGHGSCNSPNEYSFTDANVSSGKYDYRLKQIDIDGSFKYSETREIAVGLPDEFILYPNFPNPFNPATTIKYKIPTVYYGGRLGDAGQSAPSLRNVTLKIYDVLGREIAALVNEKQTPGIYEVRFDAQNLTSGSYFYRINVDGKVKTGKMSLLK